MKYIVRGELDTTNNGQPTTVIMELVYDNMEDAEKAKLERQHSYKNLSIIEQITVKV